MGHAAAARALGRVRGLLRDLVRDLSLPAAVAGFVAVLVGFSSSVVIVFQAASALGATPAQTASWLWALGLGMGFTTIALSLWYRQPVLTAWSTPGAALLATAGTGLDMAEAVGAFMVCAALTTLAGATGLFARLMDRVPQALAAALLAGVLARFAFNAFTALQTNFGLVGSMLLAYLLGRRAWPRYAVPGVLLVGVAVAALQGQMAWHTPLAGPANIGWGWASPVFTAPRFSWQALVGVALPLFVVTMASQNLPGVVVQRAHGYNTPVSPVVTTTGLASGLLAPLGCFALNLAAITAAICMGREAHEDPKRRYTAAVVAGVFYIATGLAAGAVVALIAAFPKALVLAVAGLALIGAITSGLNTAMQAESSREAALITFLVAASGLTLWGVGAAFWGVVAGAVSLAVQHWRPFRKRPG